VELVQAGQHGGPAAEIAQPGLDIRPGLDRVVLLGGRRPEGLEDEGNCHARTLAAEAGLSPRRAAIDPDL